MIAYVYSERRELVVVAVLENFEFKGADKAVIGVPPLELYIQGFLASLRFKGGAVQIRTVLYYPKIWRDMLGSSSKSIHIISGGSRYMLNVDEVEQPASLLRLYNQVKDDLSKQLKIALRWFNKSCDAFKIEDKVLGLAIAFETMFKGLNIRFLLYRFISPDKNKRKEIAKHMDELRKARNSIVHAGHSKKPRQQLLRLVSMAEDIFRQSFQKFLQLLASGKNYEEILEEIILNY